MEAELARGGDRTVQPELRRFVAKSHRHSLGAFSSSYFLEGVFGAVIGLTVLPDTRLRPVSLSRSGALGSEPRILYQPSHASTTVSKRVAAARSVSVQLIGALAQRVFLTSLKAAAVSASHSLKER
jgi:hypothetical protein